VAIINETLAALYFPQEDPIGKRITHIGANQNEGDPEQWEIVGVIGDVHHSSLTAYCPRTLLALSAEQLELGNFLVRTTNECVFNQDFRQ
jgi:hypothetical protein